MKGLDCFLGPLQGAHCHFLLLYLLIGVVRCHCHLVFILLWLSVSDFPYEPAINKNIEYCKYISAISTWTYIVSVGIYNTVITTWTEAWRYTGLVVLIRFRISLRAWVPGLHFLVLWRGWWCMLLFPWG